MGFTKLSNNNLTTVDFATFEMLKTILSFFKPLSREQLEVRSLQSAQESRLLLEARSEATAAVAAEVIDLVTESITVDDDDVGTAVRLAFAQIDEDLLPTTTTVQLVRKRRHQNVLKPDNWREITQHYIIHKNALSTIEKMMVYIYPMIK